MGNDPGARMEVFFQIGPQQLIRVGHQVDGDYVGGTQVRFEQVAMDYPRLALQTVLLYAFGAGLHQGIGNLDTHSFGVETLDRGDQNPAIATA